MVVAVLLSPVALAQQPGGPTEVKKASVPKKEITPEELYEIYGRHLLWLKNKKDPKGAKADLRQTNLKGVDLNNRDLQNSRAAVHVKTAM